MKKALIGFTGFVGSTLIRQSHFDELYRSTNINEIRGKNFDLIVCAAAPAWKWLANKNPEDDYAKVSALIDSLSETGCSKFILISTVDVFRTPIFVYEDSETTDCDLHPYGRHRLLLEQFVERHFSDHLIVRLPGLVGPGLKKNVVFDLLNSHNLHMIDSRSVYQFYPVVNLWFDILTSISLGLQIIHLTAEPISVAEVAKFGFGIRFEQELDAPPVQYDLRSRYAHLFGSKSDYQYTRRESIQAIRYYAQFESMKR